MIDINGAVQTALTRLKKLPVGRSLELLTFKRDRGVRIRKTDHDCFEVAEFGFLDQTVEANQNSMKKLLKTVIKREFPRSNKVRVLEG